MTSEHTNNTPKPPKSTSNRGFWVIGGVAALVMTSVLGAQAFTSSKTYQHIKAEGGIAPIAAHWGGHRGRGSMTEEQMNKRVEKMVKHLAIEIEANDEQEVQLIALAKAFIKDARPRVMGMRDSYVELTDILTAETIDKAALEQVRASRLAEIDAISKEFADTVAKAAEVLTPEQRKIVAERVKMLRSMRGRWHRG
ncbi:MAG: Spy/CpxP family protein refolding chaperone [Pseudomonadota bacterium]